MIESNYNNLYPIIISVPHSGSKYSESFLNSIQVSKNELKFSEDSYVDNLLSKVLNKDFSFVKANFPRSYVDVNRHPFEIDPFMISSKIPIFKNSNTNKTKSGIGVIPRVSIYGNDIYNHTLTRKEIISRLLLCYFPYHKKLKLLIRKLKNEYTNILVLDFHSMPSNSTQKNTDIIIGNNYNESCNKNLTSLITNYFNLYNYSVEENNPYPGGYITKSLGKPKNGINVIQIEINRALYMNEKTLLKNKSNMNLLKENLHHIIQKIFMDINKFN
tara:strand:+ start:298 stop:1116 length:819 start_codon:yes stop_codon:yes gene_type:complete